MSRDRCAAGRSLDASGDEETRGGKGDYTGGGRCRPGSPRSIVIAGMLAALYVMLLRRE